MQDFDMSTWNCPIVSFMGTSYYIVSEGELAIIVSESVMQAAKGRKQ